MSVNVKIEKKEALNIKKLFNKDNEYMTFIENNNLLSFSLSSKDKIKGFKCTESHDKKNFLNSDIFVLIA